MKSKTIKKLKKEEIIARLESFASWRKHEYRYASFDYCFNYFQQFKDKGDKSELVENMQHSCLQLGFYLASWGMYRGSTFLLQKSVKVFEDLIKYIASPECDVWDIDAYNYSENGNMGKLIGCADKIKEILRVHKPERENWDTLVTKIMLGVFGNIPAFDKYFKDASGLAASNKKAMENALEQIMFFYNQNKDAISQKAEEIKTLSFEGGETKITYTKAKIIDMIFFQKGLDESIAAELAKKEAKHNSAVHNQSGT